MQKQVDKSHYKFSKYVYKGRWISIWHQLDEVTRLEPRRVLEIGPGPGLFKASAQAMGVNVDTLDIDSELQPDYVASVFDMPFEDSSYDIVCAFQMLEHLPYEKSLLAFKEMNRVANKNVVISLPDAATRYPVTIQVPKIGFLSFGIPRPRFASRKHKFDGEHYWEINKRGYALGKIVADFLSVSGATLARTYRVPENPYHRFFIFEK